MGSEKLISCVCGSREWFQRSGFITVGLKSLVFSSGFLCSHIVCVVSRNLFIVCVVLRSAFAVDTKEFIYSQYNLKETIVEIMDAQKWNTVRIDNKKKGRITAVLYERTTPVLRYHYE